EVAASVVQLVSYVVLLVQTRERAWLAVLTFFCKFEFDKNRRNREAVILPCSPVFNRSCCCYLAFWFDPYSALVHQINLFLNDLLAIFSVLHRFTIQIEVLRINRLFVEQLVQLGAQVFHPVVPLGTRAVVSQSLDIDDSTHIGRTSAVFLATDDLAFVVDNKGAPTEGIDGGIFFRMEIIGAHVGSD